MIPVIEKTLVSWDKPFLESAADLLLQQEDNEQSGRPLDLGNVLVLMQTSNAGRRLRELIAMRMWRKCKKGIFPPLTGTPYQLVRPTSNSLKVATPMQCLLGWCHVLDGLDWQKLIGLFPKPEALQGASARLALANSLESLRTLLTDADLDCRAVFDSGKVHESEARRWEALAYLEKIYLQQLKAKGFTDPRVLQRESASIGNVPEGVSRIVLLGVTDLSPLTQKALAQLPDDILVQIVCFGEEGSLEDAFDNWGRPKTSYWKDRNLDWENIHVSLDEVEECQKIAGFFEGLKPERRASVGIGVVDSNLVPILKRSLDGVGCDAYDPAGDPAHKLGLHALLKSLLEWVRQKSFRQAEALLRFPVIQELLDCKNTTELLHGLDLLRNYALPSTLADALAVQPLKLFPKGGRRERQNDADRSKLKLALTVLGQLEKRLQPFAQQDFSAALKQFLEGMNLEPWANLQGLLFETLNDLSGLGEGLATTLQFQVVIEQLGKLRTTSVHESSAIELQGWLELVWEDAPHLLLAGFQDSAVPESISGDLFIPESLQVELGLPGNEARLVRDAWQSEAILQTRKNREGRVDVMLCRKDIDGNSLLPSRLLFHCADILLPARVNSLFGDLPVASSAPPWSAPWKLQPEAKVRNTISVTHFKNYLDSPLMFFLKREGSDEVDPDKADMSPSDFGTLLHAVLETLKGEADSCTDPDQITKYLKSQFSSKAKARFGEINSALLKAQFGSALERLRFAAIKQSEVAGEGWRIYDVERRIQLDLCGIKITGIIDRIDYNENSGKWRLIDYKTSGTSIPPLNAHWGVVSRSKKLKDSPSWARFTDVDGNECAWRDLQLPLYVLAWKSEISSGEDVQTGYFNLPSSENDSGFKELILSLDILDSATKCAEAIIEKITKVQQFWPLGRKLELYEQSYKRLFFHDVEATLEPPVVQEEEASNG